MDNDRRMKDGIAVIAAIVLMALIGLSLLVSCKTKETVTTETAYVHDTVWVSKSDTLWKYEFITQRDTTYHEVERIVTLNEKGDTSKVIVNNYIDRRTFRSDSIDVYKAISDSLKSILKQQQSKEKVKTERIPLKWFLLLAAAFLSLVAAVVALVVRSFKNRKE